MGARASTHVMVPHFLKAFLSFLAVTLKGTLVTRTALVAPAGSGPSAQQGGRGGGGREGVGVGGVAPSFLCNSFDDSDVA